VVTVSGNKIEPFGPNTFGVKSAPSLLVKREIRPLVQEVVEKSVSLGLENETDLTRIADECRMIIACHSAIRANQALSDEQMKGLFRQLDHCEDPSRCPHGRPTWVNGPLPFWKNHFTGWFDSALFS